jgi:hypothetical protein
MLVASPVFVAHGCQAKTKGSIESRVAKVAVPNVVLQLGNFQALKVL